MYVVDAERPEVPPVAVMVLVPPFVSATVTPAGLVVPEPVVVVVMDIVVPPVFQAGAETVTDSLAPKPATVMVGEIASSGKP